MGLEGVEGSEDEPALDITATGDLVLQINHGGERFLYRVAVTSLTKTSPYFKNLLEGDFGESIQVQRKLKTLDRNKIAELPHDALPLVKITDLGRISKVNTIRNLVEDFLNIVHGNGLSKSSPISNLANLAIVADRFDCLPSLITADRRLKPIQANERRKSNALTSVKDSEERTRQKLLIGILLDRSVWVSVTSKSLIIGGSTRWKPDAVDESDAALWWDLPHGIEEELICRRTYLLETLESLQSHFLKLYSSTDRQCKLGYDTSPQCDSFQLGEMIRFFQRINSLRLEGTLATKDGIEAYSSDIERILDALHSCNSYQINQHHSHCGLRTRLVPLLEALHPFIRQGQVMDLGICGECWRLHRSDYAWTLAKRPIMWGRRKLLSLITPRARIEPGSTACLASHARIRELCMARERDWTGQDEEWEKEESGSRITLGMKKI
jgi:hypothetical protein